MEELNKQTARGRAKFIALILFIMVLVLAMKFSSMGQWLTRENLTQWIESAGIWGPLVYIVIYSIAPSLLLPGLPLTVAGGVLFGPFWGIVYTSVGATIGAALAFLVARHMGREWVEGFLKQGSRWRELDGRVETQGWKIVAITRLIPLFPFNLLNYAFGLTRIKFTHYVAASFVFMLPGITAYVLFSSSLPDLFKGNISKKFLAGLVLIVLISGWAFLYRKRGRKAGGSNRA